MGNEIEVYYKNRKGAGVSLILLTPLLVFIDCFFVIATIGGIATIWEDFKSGLPMLVFFLALGVGFIFLTKWFITRMYRVKWLLVTVNGSRITMRDKRRNAFCVDISEVEGVDWKFIMPRVRRKDSGTVTWQESLVIKTGSRSFIVPHDCMDGYEKFLAYIQQNVAPEKMKKMKIDYNKDEKWREFSMEFDASLEEYVFETDGVIFAWEEEPQGNYEEKVRRIAANYKKQIGHIIEFMLPDLREMYGDIDVNEVETKLGKPIIELGSGVVTYCEQMFDDVHIFSFEYLDDEFQKLQYFCVDG